MSKKDEALKLALETSEGIVNADWRKWDELASPSEFERWAKSRANFMATILREALAEQPAQQPAAFVTYKEVTDAMNALYTGDIKQMQIAKEMENKRLYTSPPAQRTWVGLTDEERGQIINANFGTGLWAMAKNIEAKLKEKNT